MRNRLLLAIVLLSLVSCGELFQKPRVRVRRVDIVRVDFTRLDANLVLAVQNPNVIGIDLAHFGYKFSVDNHTLLESGAGRHALHVPAGGSGELSVPIGFKYVELAEALESLFTKREVPFKIAVQLGFGSPVGVIDVPLSYSSTFPVPQLPTLALGAATVASASLTGAQLSATIQVHNQNGFALPVGALRVAVHINGVELANASTPAQQLAGNATVPVRLAAQLSFLQAGLGVARAVQSHSAAVALDGSFDLLGYVMPVHLHTTLR